ncbi:MAG TPA: hypothetical protein DEH78_06025 [Solibacterales bacterium]|nr:hypothetical protein [Bryobacterales bacterium]
MIAVLALLMAFAAPPPSRVTLLDDPVRVRAGEWRTLPIVMRQQPGVVQAWFRVKSGGGIRLLLLTKADANLWRAGRAFAAAGQTAVAREGQAVFPARTPGDYELVVDYSNAEGGGPAELNLKVEVAFGNTNSLTVRYLDPERKLFVIWASVCFFGAVVWFAGIRLVRAAASRE